MPENYQNLDRGMAYTLEKEKARRKKSMIIVLCSVFVLLALVGGGVAAWYFLSHRKTSGGSTGDSAISTGSNGVDIGSDPSNFKKDPRLHKSFYGLAYTPEGALMPNCGAKLGAYNMRTLKTLHEPPEKFRLP
ncbi:hypothetical protein NP233_g8027 [Leucocoprinus birnbaumii]|uniref:Uncharacterized protein n=1 Tax=Leucocoprinus birnbaumii TaxID=56174 RepID=A0AAD5VRJ7_9AGAR|nr:hypothetical protein NP233_g8027 [Leucocoprinus birnbaumii]